MSDAPVIEMTDDEIRAALKRDVLEAVHLGHKIRMDTVGMHWADVPRGPNYQALTVYEPDDSRCMCVMGARLRGMPVGVNAAIDFAETTGRPKSWGFGFLDGSDTNTVQTLDDLLEERQLITRDIDPEIYTQGWNMGQEMLAWVRAEGIGR